ncbi:DoxX-like family protein [Paenibacillus yanchengensis]|uniref:DoxX-like family protein n=1 Tax=Paenibacillus yanchengensis TaxID=2035833 RepID=A0ABW4YJ44_9BACL
MRRKPIYVEIDINTDMDTLWHYTQRPELHEQWDLRFSEIRYLPREKDDDKQHFLYRTRIGFGLNIAGTGVTKGGVRTAEGERFSSLSFSSEQIISLIKQGRGYWKYTPHDNGVTFVTQYDYETRFGLLGKCFDYVLFRPLFGMATAWSFDVLRIWLEKGIQPALSMQRALVHYLSVLMISLLWIYQGLVPKVLFPEAGELAIMQEISLFHGWESELLWCLGIAEISIGLLTILWHRKRWIYMPQVILLTLLAVVALIGTPELLKQPFNPLTLSGSMIAFCLLARLSNRELPQAKRCIRKRRRI